MPEGMVHALEEVHRLLRPAGTLIEIHPVTAAWVEVRHDSDVPFVEPDPGFDWDDDIRPAEEAVETVVGRGLFELERVEEVDFLTWASTVGELRDYFASVGGYSARPPPHVVEQRDQMYRRVEDYRVQATRGAEVVYRERVRLSRLAPVGTDG